MKIVLYFIWFLVLLLLMAASNYLINMEVYNNHLNVWRVVMASTSATVLLVFVAGSRSMRRPKLLFIIQFLLVFVFLFVVLAEVLIYQFSGVAYETQTFLHFEPQALWIGFAIQPVKYSTVVLLLAVLSVILIQFTRHRNTVLWKGFAGAGCLGLLFSFYGVAPGRLIHNYLEFTDYLKTEHKTAAEIRHLEPFGIRVVDTQVEDIEAEVLGDEKNLIIIYLESFSLGFHQHPQYPGLTPELTRLVEQHGSFKDYHSTAKFTMQGLISSFCGLVPKMVARNNIIQTQFPYNNLPCLTDVLKKLGYRQEFLGGARKSFSNKGRFLKSKGFDQVYGWVDFNKGKKYVTNDWGLQDSDLFDFALQRVFQLNAQDNPFHLSLLTLATHLNGNPDPNCPIYDEKNNHHKYIQGIHCADYLLGRFVDQLEQSGLLTNTTVLITSDHGVFHVPLIKDHFGKHFKRNELLGILIDDHNMDLSKPMGLYDMAPLLMSALNIKSNVQFINGRSPDEIQPNRFILRESILNGDKVNQTNCVYTEKISFPISPCENERLLQSNWRYAHNFTQQPRALSLHKDMTISRNQNSGLMSFSMGDQEQTSGLMIEGYPLSEHARMRYSHLHVWVVDEQQKQMVSKNSYRLDEKHMAAFKKLIQEHNNREQILFLLTEQGQFVEPMEGWEKVMSELGIQGFDFPDKAFFSVIHKRDQQLRQRMFNLDTEEGNPLVIDGPGNEGWFQ